MSSIAAVTLRGGQLDIPAGVLTDVDISPAANIQASKVIHQNVVPGELYAPATAVAAITRVIAGIDGSTGVLEKFEVAITGTLADDASRTIAVDLQKSTGGGAFATVLTGTVNFTNASSLRTFVQGNFANANVVVGDILQVVVTVAGGSGNQAKGLFFNLRFRQMPS